MCIVLTVQSGDCLSLSDGEDRVISVQYTVPYLLRLTTYKAQLSMLCLMSSPAMDDLGHLCLSLSLLYYLPTN